MKIIFILFAFEVVASVKQEILELPKEKILDTLYKFAIPCGKKYNVDPEIVKKIADASLPRDKAAKNFLYCFGIDGGYIDGDGHIVVDRIAFVNGHHPLIEDFKESLRKCNEETKGDPVETVIAVNYCIAHNAPIRFKF